MYPRIEDHAIIGDLHTIALVGLDGITRARRVGRQESSGENMRGGLLLSELDGL